MLRGQGQDVSFSQFYANPLYLNPSFSGIQGVPRSSLQYRNQWSGIENAFNTYSFSFDIPAKFLGGGLGIHVMNDAMNNGMLNNLQANLSYAVQVRLSEFYFMRGGLQAGLNQYSLRTNELIFNDNLDMNFGNHGISRELAYLSDPNHASLDFSSGILVYSQRYFYGLALHHLAQPQLSVTNDNSKESRLPRKYTLHMGARLPVYLSGHNRKKFDISPQLILQKQGDFDQLNYGIFATKMGLIAGSWFRQNLGIRYDSVIFLLGYMRRNWQFMYSYDFTVSGLAGEAGGSSEISLSFLLRRADSKRHLPFYNQYQEEFGL